MSMTESIHPDLGREVAVGSIDRELHRLWEEDEARTNASLMNLAIYSEASGALIRNSAAVRELTREHACRALLVQSDPEVDETSIRAWITAHCHLRHGRKSVCCEQIAFELAGRATGRLSNTVFAHLNSDLPLIFWWQGELSSIFGERLYSLVDRFVFDSAEWSDPIDSFERIVAANDDSPRLVVQDLSWTRCYQFRVSVAALFDDPIALQSLDSIERVEIRHHPAHRLTALQLLAWLANQAGWRDGLELELAVPRRDGFSFETKGGQTVEAVLLADEESAALGHVRLTAGEAFSEVRHDPGTGHLTRRFHSPGHDFEAPGPADPADPADLLGEQLSRGGQNTLFRKTIPRMLNLLSR
jgi:glucose-6-phosphate dehydrogenase assembly protein OpcA